MLDIQLEAKPLLGGFRKTYQGTDLTEAAELVEVTDFSILSIAIPLGGEAAFVAALSAAFKTSKPEPGGSTLSADGKTRFIWMSPDQLFCLSSSAPSNADAAMKEKLKGTGYVTLQSDSWVSLRLSGPNARVALERICPIDLHEKAFHEGRVARTVMEHLGVIILRDSDDGFLLLSASSSADSFLHAVETSVLNVL